MIERENFRAEVNVMDVMGKQNAGCWQRVWEEVEESRVQSYTYKEKTRSAAMGEEGTCQDGRVSLDFSLDLNRPLLPRD